MESRKELFPNADNEVLGPFGGDPADPTPNKGPVPQVGRGFTIGFLADICGEGGKEIPDFAVTRYELLALVRFWARKSLGIQWEERVMGQTGSYEWRMRTYAGRRIENIADLIGDEPVNEAIEEAREEFGKKRDPYAWWVFCHGGEEDWEVLDKITMSMMDEATAGVREQIQSRDNDPKQGEKTDLDASDKSEGRSDPPNAPNRGGAFDPGRRDPANDN